MSEIDRPSLIKNLNDSIDHFRVTALLGPRQFGKTTLARTFDVPRENYFDLEDPLDQARLQNPRDVLGNLTGLVIIDEFLHQPDLFPILRALADRKDQPARFLILGSASPQLMKGASESLASRVNFIHMGGLNSEEVGTDTRNRLWLPGRSWGCGDD